MSATDYYKLLRPKDDRTRTVHLAPFESGAPGAALDAFNACDVKSAEGDRIVQWDGGDLATVKTCGD